MNTKPYQWMVILTALMLLWAVQAGAVGYTAGPPIALDVKSSQIKLSSATVGPGQVVRLTISASDVDYQTLEDGYVKQVDDTVTLSWEASAGRLDKRAVGNNPMELSWVAPTQPGNYAIFITAANNGRYVNDPPVRQVIEISVQRAGGQELPPSILVSATPGTVYLRRDNATTITAEVKGADVAGKEVRFFATQGTLSAARAVTGLNGTATVKLSFRNTDNGMVTISASYGNTTATATVQVVPEGDHRPNPFPGNTGLFVDVTPPTLPADGRSEAIVTARLTDNRGNGIAQQVVLFRASMGRIQQLGITDYWGYARARLAASNVAGTGVVTVEAGALRGNTAVVFTPLDAQVPVPQPGAAARVLLTVDPTIMPADGVAKARVEALVLDDQGRAQVNTPVFFAATLGALQQTTVNSGPDGKAATTLIAPDRPGQGVISAVVGQVRAAAEVTFQGQTAGASLDIRAWSGQDTAFIAKNWLTRLVQVEGGLQSAYAMTISFLDGNAKVVSEVALPKNSVMIYDQYGVARGYGQELDGKAQLTVLKPDGSPARTATLPLPLGSHLVSVRYAEPAGNLLMASAMPDGTRPEIHFLDPAGTDVLALRDGLEALPVMALGGDGLLVVALPGGTVRLYNAGGTLVTEGCRTDGLQARDAAVATGGEWFAVAAGPKDQGDARPKVTVFSRTGTIVAEFEVDARQLAPAGATGLLAGTPEKTVYLNLGTRRIAWSLDGNFERFLPVQDYGIIAGQRDPQTGELLSRILVIRLADGQVQGLQEFLDLRSITAVLPPDEKGLVSVVTGRYILYFPLPTEK